VDFGLIAKNASTPYFLLAERKLFVIVG